MTENNLFLTISDKYLEKQAAPVNWGKFFSRGTKGAVPGAMLGAGLGGVGGFVMPTEHYDMLGRPVPVGLGGRLSSAFSGAAMGGIAGGAIGAGMGMKNRAKALMGTRGTKGAPFMTQSSAGTKWTGAYDKANGAKASAPAPVAPAPVAPARVVAAAAAALPTGRFPTA